MSAKKKKENIELITLKIEEAVNLKAGHEQLGSYAAGDDKVVRNRYSHDCAWAQACNLDRLQKVDKQFQTLRGNIIFAHTKGASRTFMDKKEFSPKEIQACTDEINEVLQKKVKLRLRTFSRKDLQLSEDGDEGNIIPSDVLTALKPVLSDFDPSPEDVIEFIDEEPVKPETAQTK